MAHRGPSEDKEGWTNLGGQPGGRAITSTLCGGGRDRGFHSCRSEASATSDACSWRLLWLVAVIVKRAAYLFEGHISIKKHQDPTDLPRCGSEGSLQG